MMEVLSKCQKGLNDYQECRWMSFSIRAYLFFFSRFSWQVVITLLCVNVAYIPCDKIGETKMYAGDYNLQYSH